MKVYTIYTNYSINYLVQVGKRVLLIDCSCKLSDIKKLTNRVDGIILTHGHFDHFSTLQEVQEYYSCPVFMHKKAAAKLANAKLNASRFFGQIIECKLPQEKIVYLAQGRQNICGVPVIVYYAPGHTNCSIIIEIGGAYFVGDFVFANTYGRTDLPTGDFAQMQQSLAKYRPMLATKQVFSGH